jgi:hypothetical protein
MWQWLHSGFRLKINLCGTDSSVMNSHNLLCVAASLFWLGSPALHCHKFSPLFQWGDQVARNRLTWFASLYRLFMDCPGYALLKMTSILMGAFIARGICLPLCCIVMVVPMIFLHFMFKISSLYASYHNIKEASPLLPASKCQRLQLCSQLDFSVFILK